MSKVAEMLLDIYGGNGYHARAIYDEEKQKMYYIKVDEPLSIESLEKHLKGEETLGSYPISSETETVKYVAWDVDSPHDLKSARDIVHKIIAHISHLPYTVVFSGNKGYHVYLYLEEPVPAQVAHDIAVLIRDMEDIPASGNPHVECYPKQGRLRAHGYGNLLKIPLGLHPMTHNRSIFVDPRNGFENGVPLVPEEILKYRVTVQELMALRDDSQTTIDKLAKEVALEWDEGRRHDLCLYLSGYLAQIGWSHEQTLDLVHMILKERPDDVDEYNREQAIKDTYRRHNRGETVAGFQSLSDIVSGRLLKYITDIAPLLISPAIARQIDNIRFSKGPTWVKVRSAAQLIWNWLVDSENGGRILRVDPTGLEQEWHVYYFEQATKKLHRIESRLFDDLLYNKFSLPAAADGFTQAVKGHLVARARTEGTISDIYKRSVYIDGILYVNLGGADTYVLDGSEQVQVVDNGTNGLYFLPSSLSTVVPDVDNNVDVWDELINYLSFETSEEATMDPAEQKELLKAWVIAYFFRSIMPTRPILTLLGLPGSGKTTAIRQIMRVIEGLDQNVTGLADDKQDSWRAILENESFVVLDNLETTRAKWLAVALDLIATGQIIQLRQLYTTNEMYAFKPDAMVAITAVELPFNKDTVFERMLVLNMQKLKMFTPAHVIEERLKKVIHKIWGDLLIKLNEVVNILNTTKSPKLAMEIRMADFAHFCMHIRKCSFIDTDTLESGLRQLSTAQQVALSKADNSAYPLLLEWIENETVSATKPRKMSEIYDILHEISKQKGTRWHWNSASGLSRHITAMKDALQSNLGMKIDRRKDHKGRPVNWYSFHILPSDKLIREEEEEEQVIPRDEHGRIIINYKR